MTRLWLVLLASLLAWAPAREPLLTEPQYYVALSLFDYINAEYRPGYGDTVGTEDVAILWADSNLLKLGYYAVVMQLVDEFIDRLEPRGATEWEPSAEGDALRRGFFLRLGESYLVSIPMAEPLIGYMVVSYYVGED